MSRGSSWGSGAAVSGESKKASKLQLEERGCCKDSENNSSGEETTSGDRNDNRSGE